MSSTYGEILRLSVFGQSHGPAIGMTLDGIPAGLPVDLEQLSAFLQRRAPGNSAFSTARKEADRPEFLSGLVDGVTCGAPICAVIYNHNARSADYDSLRDCPRPGHADFTAQIKYGGCQDAAGGGHFSGRLTAPICIAGGLCRQWLRRYGVEIGAHLCSVGAVSDARFDPMRPDFSAVSSDFPVIDRQKGAQMCALVASAKAAGDSIGGSIECAVTGLPVGLGEPMFGGMESRIAQIVYGIPAVKGLEFGAAAESGRENNDPFTVENGEIRLCSNHCGGILGGITAGTPLIFTVKLKPTPSIAMPQKSVSFSRMEEQTLEIKGRHDPCIAPRAVPVVEAAAALAVFDAWLLWKSQKKEEPSWI